METYKSYMKVNKYSLCVIGSWPQQSNITKLSITILIWISLLIFLAAQITALVKFRDDFDMIAQTLPPIFTNLVGMVCLLASSVNKKKIALLLAKMEKQWKEWASHPVEFEFIRKNADIGRKLCIMFIVVVFAVMVEYISVPLVPIVLDIFQPLNETRPRRLMIVADYYVNTDDHYFLVSVHAIYSCIAHVTVFLSIDGIFIVFVYHACGQLAILGFRLKNIVKMDYDYSNGEDDILEEIKFCVKLHKSIIIFVNDIKDCFSTPYFFAMGLNMLMISFTMVQMIINIHDPREVIACLLYALGQMFMLLCLTLPCQRLIDYSLQIPICLHDGLWYKMSLKAQKMLIIIIMRSANPCTFTAGKLYTFSMQSYGAVVKASVSYLTVLTSVRE